MIETISTYTTAIEAHIVRGRLEAEGIPAFVAFEHHIWAKWSLSLLLGGVRLQVPRSYHEAARAVIEKIQANEFLLELEEEFGKPDVPSCPTCGSVEAMLVAWPWKGVLLLLFMTSLPLPYSHHLMKCRACGYSWLAREQRGYPLRVTILAVIALSAMFVVTIAMVCEWCKVHCENYICG